MLETHTLILLRIIMLYGSELIEGDAGLMVFERKPECTPTLNTTKS